MPPASADDFHRHHDKPRVRRRGQRLERPHVAVGDEVAQPRQAMPRRRIGHHLRRLRLRTGQRHPRLRIAIRRLLAALGRQDQRLLLALGAQDRRLALALGAGHRRTAFALRGHLQVHRADQVLRRLDFPNFDARDLHAPWLGRAVQDDQQRGVDALARRQRGVQFHLADHRTDVGHRKRVQRERQVADLICSLLRLHHPVVDDAVDRDRGVVAGDDALFRNLDDLLLHVQLAADAIDIGQHEVQSGLQQARVGAEALDGPDLALRHGLHPGEQGDHDQDQQENPDDDDHVSHGSRRRSRSLPLQDVKPRVVVGGVDQPILRHEHVRRMPYLGAAAHRLRPPRRLRRHEIADLLRPVRV